ncbi:MAG: YicC family protein [Deferribacteres bacterium]|nr:YicC family protein [candidate division KSB1 bacterium]MCB9501491.1 YicC family protein [Deferribacteres bacterium]
MIISMTGFGKGSHVHNGFEVDVEAKSLNHRFLDLFLKLPRGVENREYKVREILKKHLERGRISLTVTFRRQDEHNLNLQLNKNLVNGYKKILVDLSENLGTGEKTTLSHLLALPDIFFEADDEQFQDNVWNCIESAVEKSLVSLNEMRQREGSEIEKDLRQRLQIIDDLVSSIEVNTQGRSQLEFDKLYDRLKAMMRSGELDPSRLELEIALLADRVDVTEECTRLRSHNTIFIEALSAEDAAGRKLNFLLQEMNREANTIGAKCNDADISHRVVSIKEEIEKLREQVQNVE